MMTETPLGLSLDMDDTGFVLRRKESNGDTITVNFSEQEFWGLKATIELWTDRLMSARQVESGSVQPIVAHPVAQVRLHLDAVQANILLTVAAPSGEQMTLELPPHVAQHLVDEVPPLLAQMSAAKSTKQ
jgi:hypothetical protein